jgi:UDP-glucose 4-epimerase
MKCLVTGGCGFIGSHVVDVLIDSGYDVLVVDKKLANTNHKAKYAVLDVTDFKALRRVMREEEPELVCHYAAQVSVPYSVEKPLEDARNNVEGTLNVLKISQELGVKNFVYASTCAVYGSPETRIVSEESSLKPESPYSVSKLVGEFYVPLFAKNFCVLRYANVYGPRQKASGEGAVVQSFMKRMKSNGEVVIHWDGNQVRDFVFVRDVAEVNLKALQARKRAVLNVGTGKGTSVNELFKVLKEITGYKKKPVYASKRAGDVRRVVLENSRLIRELNYAPPTSLIMGLKQTLKN